jgi:hypothetical protein
MMQVALFCILFAGIICFVSLFARAYFIIGFLGY